LAVSRARAPRPPWHGLACRQAAPFTR